jgi:hypothetical protein
MGSQSWLENFTKNCKNILLVGMLVWHFSQILFLMPSSSFSLDARDNFVPSSHHNHQRSQSICPHAIQLFPKVDNWTQILSDANDFFLRGKNFEANEAFLSRHISATYKRMELPFVSTITNTTTWDPVKFLKDFYHQHPPRQGGYNQPLPGYFSGKNWKYLAFEKHLGGKAPGRRAINILEPFKEERFKIALGPMLFDDNKQQCKLMEMDDKFFCDMASTSTATNNNNGIPITDCSVFSIGSNDEWGFEKQFTQYAPHCTVHTFDCTLTPRRMPKNIPNIVFHPYCLGTTPNSHDNFNHNNNEFHASGTRQYRSYQDLVQLAQTTSPSSSSPAPKLLKMDIEGFEYSVLLDLLRTSPPSTWPEQISMEVHWATRMVDLDWMLRTKTAAEMTLWFTTLFTMAGYLPVARKFFPVGCPSCVELLLVRIVCSS